MQEEALKYDEVFFFDLSLRLKADGIKHLPEGGGYLPVCFGATRSALPSGGLTIKKSAAKNAEAGALSVVSETFLLSFVLAAKAWLLPRRGEATQRYAVFGRFRRDRPETERAECAPTWRRALVRPLLRQFRQ